METDNKAEINGELINKEEVDTRRDNDSGETGEESVKTNNNPKNSLQAINKDSAAKENITKTEHDNSSKLAITLSAVALVLGASGAVMGYLGYQESHTPLTFLSSGVDGNSANFTEGSIADVVSKVSPSVVSIVTSTKVASYFGQTFDSSAAGTGIIVSGDGYILTNKHVIDGATSVTVVLDDGTTYEDVEVVTVDPLNDVAYIKIKDVSDLPAAVLGDSKTIVVGQQVIAIGNALGEYQNTVTSGIVSGTGRSVTATDETGVNAETLGDMIQTDAAINSGNSGGPLVNAAGEVIGINTATSATAENVGFAIPISSTKGMLAQLTESGEAARAYLGVYSVEITPSVAKSYNLPVTSGAYLYSSSSYSAVLSNSPAAKAGLKDKDIITAVNGVVVGAAGSVSNLIGEYRPGDTVQLTIVREGREMALNVTLEKYSK